MSWARFLISPPPTTSWILDGSVVAAIRREPRGGVLWAAEATPPGSFEVGPVGLQAVDRRKLVAALGSIHGRLEGARRAAVVVPTGWTRSYVLSFQDLPRRQREIEQVVQWRLKKLLPAPPSELRMSLVNLAPTDGARPMLVMVAMERALSELEAAFREVGVELGLITGQIFALAAASAPGTRLLVQQEQGFLSLHLSEGDDLRLIRTKHLASSGRVGEAVRRELNLTLGYIRETLGVPGELGIEVFADSAVLEREIEDWRLMQPGVTRLPERPAPPFTVAGAEGRLGQARIQPLWAVIAEAHP
ncbi:MAG TPA: hypothetical protein PKJ99_00245 [Thermoanaerobaculales bacterium]|nr:hypothetical protein [Thermoanaerobaculales bacterium]HQL31175.1 hypothetical protein [Thermoanaerobaculales bacterium]HQN95968.1 hypothetical protein [Thermoanaerobaculales bacterium]HQP42783.1 hypothetical protein [Thermoanaerobaculales bacterium]